MADERAPLLPYHSPSINRVESELDNSYDDYSSMSMRTDTMELAGAPLPVLQDLLITLEKASSIIKENLNQNTVSGSRRRPKPLIPRWITNYLLLITFIWQVLSIGFLEVIEKVNTKNTTSADLNLSSNVVMTVFQSVHLLLVFFVSFKLAKQVIHHTVSGSLLAQSYLSTVLLFAGLYTLEYRFNSDSWIYVSRPDTELMPVLLFLRMLYFSVSTATLCGTSNIEPVKWYSDMTVAIQMLTSFVYFASILSTAMIPKKRSRFDPPARPARSFTNRIRRWIFQGND